jgi:hypothetical protein
MVQKKRPKTGHRSVKLSNHFDANILGYIFEKTNFNAKNKSNICKFGEFKLLNMNHNRQLLLGGGQSALGNAGKYLSNKEQDHLKDCLTVEPVDIIDEDEYVDIYRETY